MAYLNRMKYNSAEAVTALQAHRQQLTQQEEPTLQQIQRYYAEVREAVERTEKDMLGRVKHVLLEEYETIANVVRTIRAQPLQDHSDAVGAIVGRELRMKVKDKIEAVCTKVYGASSVEYSSRAKTDLRRIKKLELENLPICIAKTQKSLSDDPKKIGRPRDFAITVREIEIAAGASNRLALRTQDGLNVERIFCMEGRLSFLFGGWRKIEL